MTGAERGLLMLTCALGETVPILTLAQYSGAAKLMAQMQRPPEPDRPLTAADLRACGFSAEQTERLLGLLSRERQLDAYLARAARQGIVAVTALSAHYPKSILYRLGANAPSVLFCKGDVSLLQKQAIGLVGARHLSAAGRAFAEQIGTLTAKEGYVLVSGGAVGADSAAQTACLRNGGEVVVFTPAALVSCPQSEHVLYCSEEGIDLPFSAHRALARNRLIHCLGEKTFVAQCDAEKGGTWHGSVDNLKHCRTPLFVHRDGSHGTEQLIAMGGVPVTSVQSLRDAQAEQVSLF